MTHSSTRPSQYRPAHLIEPYRQRVDIVRLAKIMWTHYRGKARRVKLRDLVVAILHETATHGSPAEAAIRESLHELATKHGIPIGSVPGGKGGMYWITTEDERRETLAVLRESMRTMQERHDAVRVAVINQEILPPEQKGLF